MLDYLNNALDYAKENPGLGFIFIGLLLLTKLYKSSSSKYNYSMKDLLKHPIDLIEVGLILWFIGIGTWVFLAN